MERDPRKNYVVVTDARGTNTEMYIRPKAVNAILTESAHRKSTFTTLVLEGGFDFEIIETPVQVMDQIAALGDAQVVKRKHWNAEPHKGATLTESEKQAKKAAATKKK